ncbi:MAG: hypothetical protein K8T20_09710 [Planctomycetes bacterium]|nr:hypothetical protein [Planctomycetota bacterium]
MRVPAARYPAITTGEERLVDLAGTTGLFAVASMERSSPGKWEVLRVDGARIQFDKKGFAKQGPLEGNDLDFDRRLGGIVREPPSPYDSRTPAQVLTKAQRDAVVAAALLSRPRKA